jgi:hypothetical protein
LYTSAYMVQNIVKQVQNCFLVFCSSTVPQHFPAYLLSISGIYTVQEHSWDRIASEVPAAVYYLTLAVQSGDSITVTDA